MGTNRIELISSNNQLNNPLTIGNLTFSAHGVVDDFEDNVSPDGKKVNISVYEVTDKDSSLKCLNILGIICLKIEYMINT